MAELQTPLHQAFRLAAGELGMATAAWLFAQAADEEGGAPAVAGLRDELGRTWPVLDAVCADWLEGGRPGAPGAEALVDRLGAVARVLVVGIESRWTDALVAALPLAVRVGLLAVSPLDPDWTRLQANHGKRVELVGLADFQGWAGPRSALLTFVYGHSGDQAFVLPAWLRVAGADVRLQFRSLVGWDILRAPLMVYPRWLVTTDVASFTDLLIDPPGETAAVP